MGRNQLSWRVDQRADMFAGEVEPFGVNVCQ